MSTETTAQYRVGVKYGTRIIFENELIAQTALPQDEDCPTAKELENAQMIVRALNSQPALYAAMQGLFEHCAMIHTRWGEDCNQKEAKAAIEAARAALALAAAPPPLDATEQP